MYGARSAGRTRRIGEQLTGDAHADRRLTHGSKRLGGSRLDQSGIIACGWRCTAEVRAKKALKVTVRKGTRERMCRTTALRTPTPEAVLGSQEPTHLRSFQA